MLEYSINEVSQLTGIKPFTLRIWEKRYANMILSERTRKNTRKYKEADLHLLMRISALIKRGFRISEISSMSQDEISQKIGSVFVPKMSGLKINRLMKLAQNFDELSFDKELKHEIIDSGLESAISSIIIPMMATMEAKYIQDSNYLAVKQFAYDIIRRRLIVAADIEEKDDGEKVMIFSPLEDCSELSLLITDYIIKKFKKYPIYCGDKVKVCQIKAALEKSDCRKVILVGRYHESTEDISQYLQAFSQIDGVEKVVIDFNAPDFADRYNNVLFIKDLDELKSYIQK